MRPLRWLRIDSVGRIVLRVRGRDVAQLYLDGRDWWVGVYLAEHAVFVCPLPTVVLRIPRKEG